MTPSTFRKLRAIAGIALAFLGGTASAQDAYRPSLLRPVTRIENDTQTSVTALPNGSYVEGTQYVYEMPMEAQPEGPNYGGPFLSRSKLTGDWGGFRTSLAEKGITFDISTSQFYLSNFDGGLNETSRYGGRGDYFINIDAEKAGFGKGLFITLHGESVYGQGITRDVGALLPINLMQALPKPGESVTALTGVKFTQFLSENFAVFAGKINVLDEFKLPFTGGRFSDGFLNTNMLLNPVVVRTLPYSTFGAGAAILKDLEPVLAVSVFDTNNTPTVSGFDTFFDNGATILTTATLPIEIAGKKGHQTIGGTYSTGTYNNLQPTAYLDPVTEVPLIATNTTTGSWSIFYSFDQAFVNVCGDPKRSWGLFGNLGLADEDPSPIHWFANIGIGGYSPLQNRPLDTFGIGYFYTSVGDNLRNLAPVLLPIGDEHGFETYYNFAVTPWFRLTSDLQIVSPARERADTAVIAGIRAKIDF